MPSLTFNLVQFAADGGTQDDLDELALRVKNRRWFDLATADPDFPGFTERSEDQLPGRPLAGKIEIGRFFDSLKLLVTDEQQKGTVNGGKIYDYLKRMNAPVLGPNVGEFLYQNQELIPVELRGKVVLLFWGKIYCNSDDGCCVRFLYWYGKRWVWNYCWINGGGSWLARDRAVVLARQS